MAGKRTVLALGAVLGAMAIPAQAAVDDELTPTWVKVNICNGTQLGVRAQLAGDGSSDRMKVRFTAEWLSPGGWKPLSGNPTTRWLDAGSAEFTWGQAGWTYDLMVPDTGKAYQLRAAVEMKLGSGRTASQTTGVCTVGG